MAYSNTGIINLALGRIGSKQIASPAEKSPQAIQANIVWEYIRDEVLEARNWKFAKRKFKLARSTSIPEGSGIYAFQYAYGLPSDFLRLAKDYKSNEVDDPAVYPSGYAYVIETLSDENLYLLSNYLNSSDDFYANCIIRITDPEKYSPSFINALAWRLGAELAIKLTEGDKKFQWCMQMYQKSLVMADEVNQSFDYLEKETGSSEWEYAGR